VKALKGQKEVEPDVTLGRCGFFAKQLLRACVSSSALHFNRTVHGLSEISGSHGNE
jgi:hypothetical protein